jgi:hypothetical protein
VSFPTDVTGSERKIAWLSQDPLPTEAARFTTRCSCGV